MTFGGWAAVLGQLTAGRSLSTAEADAAMSEILAGSATPAQIAAFIVSLRMKGETVDELTGLLAAMLRVSEAVPLSSVSGVVDVVGTGGDRSHTINVSTLAALAVAGAGVPVCKHGNRAASSQCGSADLLEALGVAIEIGPAEVARCVEEAGIGFCFAPRFHPAMRHAGPTRRELGVPTVFNFLGPIANPARVRRQMIGVSDPSMAPRVAAVLAASGSERAFVVHGADGLDELSTTAVSSVLELQADGSVVEATVDPAELGIKPCAVSDLQGGDAACNADFARRVLSGEVGPHRDIVLLNAAAALVVAGAADDLRAGMDTAAQSIDSGAAAAALDRLVTVSNASS